MTDDTPKLPVSSQVDTAEDLVILEEPKGRFAFFRTSRFYLVLLIG